MTPSEQLHLDASAYANKRIAMHKEAIKQQKQTPLDERVHNGTWLAHYEGYVAGYEAQRTWVGLTNDHIADVIDSMPQGIVGWMSDWDLWEYARAVLAKFKEKNT